MRIIPNQSEKRFVSCLMKNGKKLIRLNPKQLSELIRNNPQSSFQSQLGLIQTEYSIRINPFSLDQSELGFIRIETVFHQTRYTTNLGMFNVQVLIIIKKKTGTIRTFIFRSSKIFGNVSLPLQKHHQGIKNSAMNYIT